MGKKTEYIILSGFELKDNNRGSAALGYGSIAFLKEKGFYTHNEKLCMLHRISIRFFKKNKYKKLEFLKVAGEEFPIHIIRYIKIEWLLFIKFKIIIPFTPFGRMVKNLKLVAATNGGDGLSDIYGFPIFISRLKESKIAIIKKVKLIIMPQTIGPFSDINMKKIANDILSYASKIYVRDSKYTEELDKLGLLYEREKDLSAWMQPEPWDIEIEPGAIGLNVSGLAYFNIYRTLAGKFDYYPMLIQRIIEYFQSLHKIIYLIPHSYNFDKPEFANDDLEAIIDIYNKLEDKNNIVLINKDLTSPQIKYVISKMSFFIGTRMHANFAAIYSQIPVFGLAYSYKFAGAFEANGISPEQTTMITSLNKNDVDSIINKIKAYYSNI